MQYPGPTLLLNEGQTVTVNLTNSLDLPASLPAEARNVSIVFPGHVVTASGGVDGPLTKEALPGGTVTYTFTAAKPGTYYYRSGTRPDLQVEMGLVGAIVVRPNLGANYAYGDVDTHFDREFLYLLTEMDPRIHRLVECGNWDAIDTTAYFPTNWFINGRNWPDVMSPSFVPWLPTQPYNCQPQMKPAETVLVRVVGAGRDLHPLHLHGNNFRTIAVDGRLLSSGPGNGPDLGWSGVTLTVVPGQTADAFWTWNAQKLGWDIYGHTGGEAGICVGYIPGNPATYFDPVTKEYCPDHGVPFPVILPGRDAMNFGPFYSGSPFLGSGGDLNPGNPGLNAYGGYFYMWHSHTEKELTSNDLWPGGLVSFMIVQPPNANIVE
jgi:manganese oxidase